MDNFSERNLTERQVREHYITPALVEAGWDLNIQIRQEVKLTRRSPTDEKVTRLIADYVLYYSPTIPIAVIEAKGNNHSIHSGLKQAIDYARFLDIPFAYSSNGNGFLEYDLTVTSSSAERTIPLNTFPSPIDLWQRYCASNKLTTQAGINTLVIRPERKRTRYFTEKLGEAIGLDMILIPAGSFLMGSPEDEPERSDDEGPQHEVTVPTFFMGRYPVTQSQWQFVAVELSQVKQELNPDPSNFKGDKRPVEQVSWYDAVEFCARLSAYTGRSYRLPSEAEWEYACRAGTTTPFYFGNTLRIDLANYNGNYTYNDGPTGEYRKETTPIDHFEFANAFGLSDMHGNVYEWCADHWHDSYKGAPADESAWLSEHENDSRTLRGGSWFVDPRYCRSAYRSFTSPDDSSNSLGFRVVCGAVALVS